LLKFNLKRIAISTGFEMSMYFWIEFMLSTC